MMLESALTAFILAPIVLLFGYRCVVPRVMSIGYKRGISETQFDGVEGGAGSADIEYYTLYYDVREKNVVISGVAPEARHWQIAAFDGFARVIDGAYGNQHTIKVDSKGSYSVRLTTTPEPESQETVFDCSTSPRGIVIFRIVLPQQVVPLPVVYWVQCNV